MLRRVGTFVSYTALSLIALLFLFPFFWMVSNAVRSNAEVMAVPVRIFLRSIIGEHSSKPWFPCRSEPSC